MKKFLAIDTSSTYLTVLASGEKTAVTYLADCAMAHSVKLLGEVEKTLSNAGMGLSDPDFFACVTGAGSFTGIRIGIATIKGFCRGEEKPALPVTSFDVAAYTVEERKTLAAIEAGHGNFYVCGYAVDKSVTFPPACLSFEEVSALSLDYDCIVGFTELPFAGAILADPAVGLQKAVEAKSYRAENFCRGGDLSALYVRKSQAEENRK